jgi:Flp pilus assembly protein TadG
MRKRGLVESRRGAVAVIFATALVPISMLTGTVIDYGFALQAKAELDVAADAAALAGVRTAAAGYAAGQTQSVYLAEGTAAANQWWAAQAGTITQLQSSTMTPNVSNSATVGSTYYAATPTFTATVAYTAKVFEVMPALFNWTSGVASIGNGASGSTATIQVHAYGTVDFLLDNTSSMMLPATDSDLAKLQPFEQTWLVSSSHQASVISKAAGLVAWNGAQGSLALVSTNTLNNGAALNTVPQANYCAFACHWSSTVVTNPTQTTATDYFQLARASGETLRFDEVQTATEDAITEMENLEQVCGQLAVGVFAFGGPNMTSSSYVNKIYSETPIDVQTPTCNNTHQNAQAAIAALANITPPITGDTPNTNIGTALADTLAITGPAGSGNTSASPLKSLILVTDGIEDDNGTQSIPSTEGPINPSVCQAFKNDGYTVYVLYTPYNSAAQYLPNSESLAPYITGASTPSVLSALSACATTSDDLIVANSQADINAGMVALIDEAVGSTTRLTN